MRLWPGPSPRAGTHRGSGSSAFAAADAPCGFTRRTTAGSKAGVAFYGGLVDQPNHVWPKSPLQLAPEMKAPVLGLYGEADQSIPVAQVEEMQAALKAAAKTADFKIYPGAPHAFHADYRASYRKEAAEDAWSRMEAWFKTSSCLALIGASFDDGRQNRNPP